MIYMYKRKLRHRLLKIYFTVNCISGNEKTWEAYLFGDASAAHEASPTLRHALVWNHWLFVLSLHELGKIIITINILNIINIIIINLSGVGGGKDGAGDEDQHIVQHSHLHHLHLPGARCNFNFKFNNFCNFNNFFEVYLSQVVGLAPPPSRPHPRSHPQPPRPNILLRSKVNI